MQLDRTSRIPAQTQPVQTPDFRPFLVPSTANTHSLLGLWHLLSLDAPSVAATWTWFIAYCSHVSLPWTSNAAIFLVVWMLYAADRLLDARAQSSKPAPQDLEERHRFHARHEKWFLTGITAAALVLPYLLHTLLTTELRLYAALGSLLFAYFFLIHLWPLGERNSQAARPRLPKELAVGVFFAAAVFIPTVARSPDLRSYLLPFALLFASICTLNCLYVYAWEHPVRQTGAHWTTRFALRHVAAITCTALIVSTAAAILLRKDFEPIAVACGVSASCFLILDIFRKRIRPTDLRAAADVALLSPLLISAVRWLT